MAQKEEWREFKYRSALLLISNHGRIQVKDRRGWRLKIPWLNGGTLMVRIPARNIRFIDLMDFAGVDIQKGEFID